MTTLYNCKSVSGIEYRITKFDRDYNVTSSYVVSNGGCDCPQGHKPTCRHRKMLPEFAKNGHIDDGFFLDFDTRQWRKPLTHALGNGKAEEEAIAKTLEAESSPKAAAVGHASALPSVPPAPPEVEQRAAPIGNNSLAGGTTIKRRKLT